MISTDDFFNFLAQKKNALEINTFLSVGDQNGLEACYCLLHKIQKSTSRPARQSSSRHSKAQQNLRNINSIAISLFVLVAVTISITDLASIDHNELFPRLKHWWINDPISEEFDLKAQGLVQELDNERKQGNLPRRKGRSRTQGTTKKTQSSGGQTVQQTVESLELTEQANTLSHSSEVPTLSSLDTIRSYGVDEETIPFHSSQLINFLQAYRDNYPQLQSLCELLHLSEPNLQLPYSLFGLASPYIHIKLLLPTGLGVNLEVSRDFSYSFIQYLWMLQGSGASRNETSN
ncbi:hypothetical protein AJ80_08400 [Polytolypa hystricis UAMH7299]|uniref:Uncharacterized protein n=1 Tax=Polytolypa hystricis (strain UAMH7299) TaxID=1447883 RepID=A0A2B7X8J7_POLH7|nr:hypothetical protein AJ80_08400 [Polytolypa hystricis UAMH7299]